MDISNNQIKLLSLTTKLNINYDELREQILQNSAEVPENEVYFKLTPAALLEYAEGKEQFAMVDLSNKVYAKPEDAQNYVSATNLMQFLSNYGIVDYDQLQKSYDALGGIALNLTNIQEAKPDTADYWSEEKGTAEEKVYATMLEKVVATLNNVSNYVCSCCFMAIEQMLAYTDVASVTEEEIQAKFTEIMGISSEEYLANIEDSARQMQELAEKLAKAQAQAAAQAAEAAAKAQQEAAAKAAEEAAKASQEQAAKIAAEAAAKAAARAEQEAAEKAAAQAAAKAAEAATKAAEAAEAKAAADAAAKAAEEALKAAQAEADAAVVEAAAQAVQEAAAQTPESTPESAPIQAKPVNVRIIQQPFNTLTNFTTSTGEKFSFPIKNVTVEATFTNGEKRIIRHDDSAMRADKAQINNKIANLRSAMYASPRSERLDANAPLESGAIDLASLSTAAQRLFSNYKMDENGTYVLDSSGQAQLKTLRQKISDAYFIAMNSTELEIPHGESKTNAGEIDENEVSIRGLMKSVLVDSQKALGAQAFDTDKYLADHAVYENEYADLAQAYDTEAANLKALQEPADAEKAQWYTNVWSAMGGEETKLGDDIKVNITRSGAGHGHSRGDYSNELSREIVFPENPVYKKSDNFITLNAEKLNDEAILKKVRLEKFVKPEAGVKAVEINLAPAAKTVKIAHSPLKEFEDIKNLTREHKSLDSFL